MGMAEATALVEVDNLSSGGAGDTPAGEATEDGKMKSSRFIGSD